MTSANTPGMGKRLFLWAAGKPPARRTPRFALWWLLRTVIICRLEVTNNFLSIRAAALTFTVLLSLVPALALSTALYKGLGGEDKLRLAAHRYLDELDSHQQAVDGAAHADATSDAADSSVTGRLRAAVDNLFNYAEKINFTGLGLVGLAGLLFSVGMAFGHLEDALNHIWHVRQGRSLLRKFTDYLAVLFVMPLSVNIALAATALEKSPALAAALHRILPFLWLQTIFIRFLPFVGLTLTLLLIYRIFPQAKVRNGPALAGAALASICWLTYQNICISLQIGLSNLNAIYGSFAALPLFCAWLSGALLILLIGGQFAYACQHALSYVIAPEQKTMAWRIDAALAVMRAAQDGFAGAKPPDAKAIAAMLPHLPPDLLHETIAELEKTRLLYRGVSGELLPAGAAVALPRQKILETLLDGHDREN
jgi:membrane protein